MGGKEGGGGNIEDIMPFLRVKKKKKKKEISLSS